jgi:hypothetical protein
MLGVGTWPSSVLSRRRSAYGILHVSAQGHRQSDRRCPDTDRWAGNPGPGMAQAQPSQPTSNYRPGNRPIIATAIAAPIADPNIFRSGENLPPGSAWCLETKLRRRQSGPGRNKQTRGQLSAPLIRREQGAVELNHQRYVI